ncbi:MAG: hypothetical protein D6800_13975 [Candidatus Zixiibacteriota bacterium]|nr:MAG: hypothetical protein D6800_13975 [candidate division Zixibacteria bacterium]
MADILGRQPSTLKGAFSLDDLRLTIPGDNGQPFDAFLVLSVQLSYDQQISRLYGINDNGVVLVSGRTQGSASFNQIVGPRMTMTEFFGRYGQICRAADNTMTLRMGGGCDVSTGTTNSAGGFVELIMSFCTLPQVTFSVTSDSAVVSNPFQMTFETLEIKESGSVA